MWLNHNNERICIAQNKKSADVLVWAGKHMSIFKNVWQTLQQSATKI